MITARTSRIRALLSSSAAVLITAAVLAACGAQGSPAQPGAASPAATPGNQIAAMPPLLVTAVPTPASISPLPPTPTPVPMPTPVLGPLPAPVGIYVAAVSMGLELSIPSLQVKTEILSVGLTPQNVMDAPKGAANDPIWQKVYWYRGSGIPGESGTATFAGHFNGREGIPAVFYDLKKMSVGDFILVRNPSTGKEVTFTVTKTVKYPLDQANDPAVLATIYGPGPVSGKGPLPSPDGKSYLTLVTCTGEYVDGSFDHRLVVYAERAGS